MKNTINVAFIGNPNCGKTTLFNAYTGANLKVANWPGVTVEKKEGETVYNNNKYKLVDLPGIYSLTSYTMEEILSRQYILGDDVDVIIDVADASSLERNLYLALQLIELGKPVILALNMMDIVEERGMEIDFHRLPEMLGIPTIPICARKKIGLNILMHAVEHHKEKGLDKIEHHHEENSKHEQYVMVYSDDIEEKIDKITEILQKEYPNIENYRWHAIKILERDTEILKKCQIENIEDIADKSYESEIIKQKYDFIEEIIEEVLVNKNEKSQSTDKLDALLTSRIWGIPIFLGIMAFIFFITFTIGDWLKEYFELFIEIFSDNVLAFLNYCGTNKLLNSLIIDGIIAGVGGILTFLPNISILFFALAFLEDSGYMSRVAYVMDGIMGKMKLSGRAFIPMILGFGCTVPAIMASRTLEDKNDRLKTILVTPFMSCSARLPIYILISEVFFKDNAMLASYSMYLIGIVVAIIAALILTWFDKEKSVNSLLIELPEYKAPNARTIFIYVWEKVKGYLTKAGTTIFIASVILWVLLNFGISGYTSDISESFAAMVGKFLSPIMAPTGLGYWEIIVSLISGIAAKEVVVSSMGVLYGIANISSAEGMLKFGEIMYNNGFTEINAYSLMIFSLLYVPCIATIATIKKETGSVKFTIQSVIMQLMTAWCVSALFYQIASLFVL